MTILKHNLEQTSSGSSRMQVNKKGYAIRRLWQILQIRITYYAMDHWARE